MGIAGIMYEENNYKLDYLIEKNYFDVNPFSWWPDWKVEMWDRWEKEWREEQAEWTPYRLRKLFEIAPKVPVFTQERRLDKNEVLANVDMLYLVQKYFPSWRRSGGNVIVKAFCHDDTRPSMSVNLTKKLYYCFSCSEGGSAITLVQKMENVSFQQALHILSS